MIEGRYPRFTDGTVEGAIERPSAELGRRGFGGLATLRVHEILTDRGDDRTARDTVGGLVEGCPPCAHRGPGRDAPLSLQDRRIPRGREDPGRSATSRGGARSNLFGPGPCRGWATDRASVARGDRVDRLSVRIVELG